MTDMLTSLHNLFPLKIMFEFVYVDVYGLEQSQLKKRKCFIVHQKGTSLYIVLLYDILRTKRKEVILYSM